MNIINSNFFNIKFDEFKEENIAFVINNAECLKEIYKDFKFIDDEESLLVVEKLNIISPQLILKLIIKNKELPFQVLYFDFVNNKYFYYHLILKLIDIKNLKIKTVIYNHLETFPLKVESKNIKEDYLKKDIKVNFHNKNYKISERFSLLDDIEEKISRLSNQNILVVLPGEIEAQSFYFKIKKKRRQNLNIFILNDQISETKFKRIDIENREKTNILIMQANNMHPLPYKNIDIIFDSYMRNFNQYKISYLYQSHLELLKTYLYKGEINLMITEEFYKNSSLLGVPLIPFYDVYKYYLMLLENNLVPELILEDIIFEKKIIEIKENLKNLNLINDQNTMVNSDLLFSFKLSLRTSLILYNFIENEAEEQNMLYPLIVLVSILEKIKYVFDEIDTNDPLEFYLNKWLDFSKEFNSLDIEKNNLKTWTEKNNLNFNSFSSILDKVKELVDNLNSYFDFEIGLFNTNILLEKSKSYLEKSYKDYIYHIKEKKDTENIIYTNNHRLAKLKKHNKDYIYPERIVSFYQNKNNLKGELDEIIFYTIF